MALTKVQLMNVPGGPGGVGAVQGSASISVGADGVISVVPGGGGVGTITGVYAGPGLSGGGGSGNVTLNNTGVLSFNGRTGDVTAPEGTITGVTPGVGIGGGGGTGNVTITNTGVLSVNGQTGNVSVPPGTITSVTAGTGLSGGGSGGDITLTNTGVLTVNGQAGNVTVPTPTITGVTAGTGISLTGDSSAPTINNTGVLSYNGRTGSVTGPEGTITAVLPGAGMSGGGYGGEVTITNAGVLLVNGQNGNVNVGTVTAVYASADGTGLFFTGSPIFNSGTLQLGGTLNIQSGGTGATDAVGALSNLGGFPSAGGTITGALNLNQRFAQQFVSDGNPTFNCSASNYFIFALNGTTSLGVTNVPAGLSYYFTLNLIVNGGSVNWFPGIQWPNGSPPSLSAGKRYLFVFVTTDGGTVWSGSSVNNFPI